MARPEQKDYEEFELPAQGKKLVNAAIRILAEHADGCEIPPPPDPGKAAIVLGLRAYGCRGRELDWGLFDWVVLMDGEGISSSSSGVPDLPPLVVMGSPRRARLYLNPMVDCDEAAYHLSNLLPRTKKYTPGAVSKRLKRAKIQIDEPGSQGSGISDRFRLLKAIELYRSCATARLKNQREKRNQRRRKKAAKASAEARSAKILRCAQAVEPNDIPRDANEPTKLELTKNPFAAKTPVLGTGLDP